LHFLAGLRNRSVGARKITGKIAINEAVEWDPSRKSISGTHPDLVRLFSGSKRAQRLLCSAARLSTPKQTLIFVEPVLIILNVQENVAMVQKTVGPLEAGSISRHQVRLPKGRVRGLAI
jgi:hypothetical protein